MERRDILKSEITELQQRLGIKPIVTRNLKSIEDCRKALVEIAKHYASVSQLRLVNPGSETELDILRKKVEILQGEVKKYKDQNLKYYEEVAHLTATNKNLEEDKNELLVKNNTLYSAINKLNSKKWWQFWK